MEHLNVYNQGSENRVKLSDFNNAKTNKGDMPKMESLIEKEEQELGNVCLFFDEQAAEIPETGVLDFYENVKNLKGIETSDRKISVKTLPPSISKKKDRWYGGVNFCGEGEFSNTNLGNRKLSIDFRMKNNIF